MIKLNKDGYVELKQFMELFKDKTTILKQDHFGKFLDMEDLKIYIENLKVNEKLINGVHTQELINEFLKQFVFKINKETGEEYYGFDEPISTTYTAKTERGLTLKAIEIHKYEDLDQFLLSKGFNARELERKYITHTLEMLEKQKERKEKLIKEVTELLLNDPEFNNKLKINERKAYVKTNYEEFYELFESNSIDQAKRNMIFEEILNQK